jgi:hypothetical protein
MGISMVIEADMGAEKLTNRHPDPNKYWGGQAVFYFLMGLDNYCAWKSGRSTHLEQIDNWYRALEQASDFSLCQTCKSLVDCRWGDGGDSTVYSADEYEWYKKRHGDSTTEEQFNAMVLDWYESWKPIDEVLNGVQSLLRLFRQVSPQPLEGFYHPTTTIPDFEALAANLQLLASRGNETVRLNFD